MPQALEQKALHSSFKLGSYGSAKISILYPMHNPYTGKI